MSNFRKRVRAYQYLLLKRKSRLLLNCTALLIVFAIGFFVMRLVDYEYKQDMQTVQREQSNLLLAFEEQVRRDFKGADEVLREIEAVYSQTGSSTFSLLAYLQNSRSLPLVHISVTNEKGIIAKSTLYSLVSMDVSSSEYFPHLLAVDDNQAYFSKPTIGRQTQTWLFHMSRRLNKPDGSFGGTATVGIDPAAFGEFYKKMQLGQAAAVAIIGLDGFVRVRQTEDRIDVGTDLRNARLFKLIPDHKAASFVDISDFDGASRINSYRVMAGFPFVLAVSVLESEALADYYRLREQYWLAGFLASIMVLGLFWLLNKILAQKELTARNLRQINEGLTEKVALRTAELEMLNKELLTITRLDGLTGIANRRSFDYQYDVLWRTAKRQGSPLTVVMADIDLFKAYNDCYGHQAGDECLRSVAAALQGSAKRALDFVARYGGEEFVVVLPDTDRNQGVLFAEKLRSRVEALNIEHLKSPLGRVTISLGVGSITPGEGSEPDSLVEAADKALYRAKNNGRNRVEHADEFIKQAAIPLSAAIGNRKMTTGPSIVKERTGNRYTKAVIAMSLVLLGVLWSLVWWQIDYDKQSELSGASRECVNLTKALEEQVRSLLFQADHALSTVKQAYELGGLKGPIVAAELQELARNPNWTQVGIATKDGIFIFSLDERSLGLDFSDREWFRRSGETADNTLHIVRTIVGRGTGKGSIPVSRRINNPDGSFGGAVVLGIGTQYFQDFFNQLELGSDKLLTVIGKDGVIRIRQSLGDQESGQDIRGSTVWNTIQTQPFGVDVVTSSLDGKHYLLAYRSMPDYPLILSIGVSLESVLAPFEQRKKVTLFGAIGISFFIVIVCILLVERNRKERAAFGQREAETIWLKRNAQIQTVMREIAEAAVTSDTLEKLFGETQRLAAKLLPTETFNIAFVDQTAGLIARVYCSNLLAIEQLPPIQRPIGNGLTEYVLRRRQAVQLDADALKQLRDSGEATAPSDFLLQEWLGAPLQDSSGRHFGLLSIFSGEDEPAFQEGTLEILSIIAAQISSAIERIKAVDSLRKSEEQYRTIAEFTFEWEYWLMPDGSLSYVSPSCERITGYRAEEFRNKPDLLVSIVHPEDKAAVIEHNCSVHRPNETKINEIEFRIFCRNGEERWINHVCRPVNSSESKHLGRRVSNRDITKRKLAEAELIDSEKRYRSVMEQSP